MDAAPPVEDAVDDDRQRNAHPDIDAGRVLHVPSSPEPAFPEGDGAVHIRRFGARVPSRLADLTREVDQDAEKGIGTQIDTQAEGRRWVKLKDRARPAGTGSCRFPATRQASRDEFIDDREAGGQGQASRSGDRSAGEGTLAPE